MSKAYGNMVNEADTISYTIDQPLVTVTITSHRTGLQGTGHSKCDPTDRWSEAFGFDLAYVRAMNRLTKKMEKLYANTLSKYNARS